MAKRTSKKTTTKKHAERAGGPGADAAVGVTTPPPRTFAEILGQDRALAALRATLEAERVHHAWIFAGPEGVGKRTAAVAFAAMLLDPSVGRNLAGELEADPDSPVQRLLRSGTHPDLRLVVKELARFSDDASLRNKKLATIPVDVVREHLIRPAALASSMPGGRAKKVFIVDEAELLAGAAQNALLKTLEEPPPGTVVILVCASEDRLLPTIRSRSQRVRFVPLDAPSMSAWLSRDEAAPVRALDEHDRAWVLRFAEGSPGSALRAAEAGLASWRAQLDGGLSRLERGEADAGLASSMHELAKARSERVASADANASKEAANKRAADDVLRLVASRWREAMREAARRGDDDRAEAYADALDLVTDCRAHADANVNLLFAFERLSARAADRFARSGAGVGA